MTHSPVWGKKAVGGILALAIAASAQAASSGAWQQLGVQIRQACAKASGLRQVQPAGAVLHFPDGSPSLSVLLLQGRYPQPHMRNQRGKELCLFNRSTQTAVVTEADQIATPPVVRRTAPKK